MALFAEITENECINDRYPLVRCAAVWIYVRSKSRDASLV